MDLKSFLRNFTPEERDAFAVQSGTTLAHLNNVAYAQRTASAALAMQIEIASCRVVTRRDLRPTDCELIWPELIGTEGATEASATEGAG